MLSELDKRLTRQAVQLNALQRDLEQVAKRVQSIDQLPGWLSGMAADYLEAGKLAQEEGLDWLECLRGKATQAATNRHGGHGRVTFCDWSSREKLIRKLTGAGWEAPRIMRVLGCSVRTIRRVRGVRE